MLLLLLPALVLFVPLLGGALLVLFDESLTPYTPGRVGGTAGAGWTLQHYRELLDPAYLLYFVDTFRIGLVATALGLLAGYPVAYLIARTPSRAVRRAWIAGLVGLLFLNIIVRVYAILLSFGPLGPLKGLSGLLGMRASDGDFAEVQVILGLLHVIMPLSALTLLGVVQNVSPRLEEAAQTLGAPRIEAFLTVTLPLSMRGVTSAFVITYAFCVSNFVVPLVLGKGIVLFVSNLVYIRFSEIHNFPSGAAISIVMLVVSVALVYGLMSLARLRWRVA